jgi:hypothetical protein
MHDVGPLRRGEDLGHALIANVAIRQYPHEARAVGCLTEPLRETLVVGNEYAIPENTPVEIHIHVGYRGRWPFGLADGKLESNMVRQSRKGYYQQNEQNQQNVDQRRGVYLRDSLTHRPVSEEARVRAYERTDGALRVEREQQFLPSPPAAGFEMLRRSS